MKKNYILKFDKIAGDYTIIEKTDGNSSASGNVNGTASGDAGKTLYQRLFGTAKNPFVRRADVSQNLQEKQENGQNSTQNDEKTQKNEQNSSFLQPSVENGARILVEVYNDLRILNMIYQVLADIKDEQPFADFRDQNIALIGSLINIIRDVGGQVECGQEMPSMPSSADEIIAIALQFIEKIRQKVLILQKLFNVAEISRILGLIETALAQQATSLGNIRLNAAMQSIAILSQSRQDS